MYEFDDKDPIFFMSKPMTQRKQLQECYTCETAFTDYKQMKYCEFCGHSNCKDCLKKTRIFPHHNQSLSDSKKEQRGKICKRCDRKFFIKRMLMDSTKTIEANKVAVKSLDQQIETFDKEKKASARNFEKATRNSRYQIEEITHEIKKT